MSDFVKVNGWYAKDIMEEKVSPITRGVLVSSYEEVASLLVGEVFVATNGATYIKIDQNKIKLFHFGG